MARINDKAIEAMLNKGAGEDIGVSLGEIEELSSDEQILRMKKDVVAYNKMLREKRTFVNEVLTELIPFTKENLYLIAAYSGSGKSTLAANIAYPLWQQGKKILIISNEETDTDIMMRLGALHLGLNFNNYKQNRMEIADQARITALFKDIRQFVHIIDNTYKNGLTSKIEGVQNALTAVQHKDYACVMIDYFQLVKYSVNDRSKKTYDVLNDFRTWLGRYIKTSDTPVVLFAQLYSQSKRPGKELDTRLKECTSIIETSTVILEVIPNYEERCSDFLVHKNRFGGEIVGRKVTLGFDKGRFVPYTDAFKNSIIHERLDSLREQTKEVEVADD